MQIWFQILAINREVEESKHSFCKSQVNSLNFGLRVKNAAVTLHLLGKRVAVTLQLFFGKTDQISAVKSLQTLESSAGLLMIAFLYLPSCHLILQRVKDLLLSVLASHRCQW